MAEVNRAVNRAHEDRAEENRASALPVPPSEAPPTGGTAGPTIRIGDEFGTAKRNLPPIGVLLLALAAVFIVAACIAFFQRATPQAGGTIVNVSAVQIPAPNGVLVALTFTLRISAAKSLWIKSVEGKLVTPDGQQTGNAMSAVDFDRYYQAFPALHKEAQPPLAPEDKLQQGQEIKRTVIINFPVSLENFNHRKSVSLVLQAYDQPLPVVVSE